MKSFNARALSMVLVSIMMFIAISERLFCNEDHKKHPREVLLINSYQQGLGWTDSITKGIADFFSNRLENISLTIENMDTKNYGIDKVFPALHELYKEKYSDNQPKVIICSDNNALNFLLLYRDELFPDVPIVFCGINGYDDSLLKGQDKITGIVEDISYIETAELAMRLNPKAKRLFLLSDSSTTSNAIMKTYLEDIKDISKKIEVIYLHDLTIEDFAKSFSKIKDEDIILNTGLHYTRDIDIPTHAESYQFIRKYTNAPIYTFWSSFKDYSTGGIMVDGGVQGETAAEMAMEILEGTPVDTIPVVTTSPKTLILNYEDLLRHGLSPDLAPEGAVFINRPFSIYEKYKWLVWSISGVILGMLVLIILLYINIIKRRKAEQCLLQKHKGLLEQEENLRVTLSSIGEGVIATDVDGCIQQINPIAELLTGWPAEEAINRPLSDVFTIVNSNTFGPIKNSVEEVIESGETISQKNTAILISRDKSECYISDSAAPIRSNDGKIIGAVLVFKDITEENALQYKLHQSQKLDAIGQLSAGVAHDFNNMLGGIISAADLAKMHIDMGSDPVRFLDVILESAERAASLTSKLLSFSRQQPLCFSPINIVEILANTISLFSNTVDKRIRITSLSHCESVFVVGDSSQLQSAFMNLFINASHAMPEGGDLEINLKSTSLDSNYCRSSTFDISPGNYAEIEIRDTGCGISQENMGKIFEPFFTTKEVGQGTGLGLSAVFGTIQQHQGSITVYSEEGVGTNFSILLPLSDTEEVVDIQSPVDGFSGTGTILIIDDEEVMRETAKALLENIGYSILLAKDGVEGRDIFEEEQDSIDLVILDMVMPEMNGRDCFWEIKKIKPDARIIVSSGFSRSEELKQLDEAGLHGFIHKPFRASDLSRIVVNTLAN